ncbi:MAG TPA: NAD(P)-binding protein, partial [Caulobacteraceae bacterium]|nr:NAD(P)-binding protein [Caulobacteraceae bacterium]
MATLTEPLPRTDAAIEAALAEAHLPTLMMSLVHLTGDASILSDDMKPVYDIFADGRLGGFDEAKQARIRDRARVAIKAHLAGAKLPPPPAPATVRRMMDFIVGGQVPEHYTGMLMEELAVDGVDQKRPRWEAPKLKSAAAKMKVVIVGAGMSGLLAAIRLQQAGVAFEIIEKNADVGGT